MIQSFLILILMSDLHCANAAETNPELFLKSCFKDYIGAFSISGKGGLSESKAVRQRCLSRDFNKSWDSIVSIDGSNADGLLLAQDYLESWKSAQKVQNLNRKNLSAEIILGTGKELHCLSVIYEHENTTLKISTVKNCPNK